MAFELLVTTGMILLQSRQVRLMDGHCKRAARLEGGLRVLRRWSLVPMRQTVGVVLAFLRLALLHALVMIPNSVTLRLANRLILIAALHRRVILGVFVSLLARAEHPAMLLLSLSLMNRRLDSLLALLDRESSIVLLIAPFST